MEGGNPFRQTFPELPRRNAESITKEGHDLIRKLQSDKIAKLSEKITIIEYVHVLLKQLVESDRSAVDENKIYQRMYDIYNKKNKNQGVFEIFDVVHTEPITLLDLIDGIKDLFLTEEALNIEFFELMFRGNTIDIDANGRVQEAVFKLDIDPKELRKLASKFSHVPDDVADLQEDYEITIRFGQYSKRLEDKQVAQQQVRVYCKHDDQTVYTILGFWDAELSKFVPTKADDDDLLDDFD